MKPRKVKDIQKVLLRKGFKLNPEKEHHQFYSLVIDGVKYPVYTYLSHGKKEYSKNLMSEIKIDHSRLYSYNGVNTNTIESFWAIVERGIIGQYHHVSLAYLPKYIVEFCFKYNNRNFDDMFETLVKASMRVKIPKAIIHDPNKPKTTAKPLKKGHLGSKKPKLPKSPNIKPTK